LLKETFQDPLNFTASGIEAIDPEKLVITHTDKTGRAAYFSECEYLKVATET